MAFASVSRPAEPLTSRTAPLNGSRLDPPRHDLKLLVVRLPCIRGESLSFVRPILALIDARAPAALIRPRRRDGAAAEPRSGPALEQRTSLSFECLTRDQKV